jgi:hypothetical protein
MPEPTTPDHDLLQLLDAAHDRDEHTFTAALASLIERAGRGGSLPNVNKVATDFRDGLHDPEERKARS